MDIVQIDSPTGHEQKMARDIAKRLRSFGLKPHVDDWGNVVAFVPGDETKTPKILNAHIDTVEPGRGIKPIIENGIIRPAGDTILGGDNKTAVAAILETTQVLSEKKFKDNGPLDLVFTVHEESETDGPRLIDYKKIKSRFGYAFDSSQPLGSITMASPFYNRIDIRVDGLSQHAAHPELAANAGVVTVDASSRLKQGRLDPDSVRNLRFTDSQVMVDPSYPDSVHLSRNTICGSMLIRGEVRSYIERLLEAYTLETKIAFLEAVNNANIKLQLAGSSDLNFNFSFEAERENGGFKYERTDPDILATETLLKRLKLPVDHYYGFGCYDANVFAEKGVKIINLGNGEQFPHTKDEKIAVEDLFTLGNLVYTIATS